MWCLSISSRKQAWYGRLNCRYIAWIYLNIWIWIFEFEYLNIWTAATKYLKPLLAIPLHWLVVAVAATSATFSKSRNRYALLRYSATATTAPPPPHPIKDSEREEAAGRRDSRPPPKLKSVWANHHFLTPKSTRRQRKKVQLNFKGSVTAFLESY